jgi:hypothetical protein
MEKVKSENIIENENLFRALVSVPLAILFVLLSINSVLTSGIVLFQVLFILLAIYFSLSAISYAAHYTNELYDGKTEPLFKNINLSKTIKFLPLAVLFTYIAVNSITTSAHIVFQALSIVMSLLLILTTIAYAAYYTNDCYDETADH